MVISYPSRPALDKNLYDHMRHFPPSALKGITLMLISSVFFYLHWRFYLAISVNYFKVYLRYHWVSILIRNILMMGFICLILRFLISLVILIKYIFGLHHNQCNPHFSYLEFFLVLFRIIFCSIFLSFFGNVSVPHIVFQRIPNWRTSVKMSIHYLSIFNLLMGLHPIKRNTQGGDL